MQLLETAENSQNGDRTMTEVELTQLLVACESALDMASRSLAMARALAEGCRSGLRPPDDVVDAYLARVEHDESQVSALRERISRLKDRRASVTAGS
jgi:hypothetical protein